MDLWKRLLYTHSHPQQYITNTNIFCMIEKCWYKVSKVNKTILYHFRWLNMTAHDNLNLNQFMVSDQIRLS